MATRRILKVLSRPCANRMTARIPIVYFGSSQYALPVSSAKKADTE